MKTPVLALALITFALQGSPAPAQTFVADADLFADADLSLAPAAPTCFKLQDPQRSCLLIGNTVVNYESPHFNLVDLNGAWAGPGNETPYIYIYGGEGNPIFVEMSLLNRPDGFGYFVDQDTILVLFPDDRDYTGTLLDSRTILWSNNTIWRKR